MSFEFKSQENPNTGAIEQVASCRGKLISIASEPKENVNGVKFRNATVELEDAQGQLIQRGCIVYESNYAYGMSVGTSYLTRITIGKDKDGADSVLITMSHLTSASNASLADFGVTPSTANADLK